MSKWIRWVPGGLALLVCMAGSVWGLSRLTGATPAQEAALRQMTDPPLTGRNAFGALWLMPYDIPEAQREAVLAEDLRRFRAATHGGPRVGTTPAPSPVSSAEGRFASVSPSAEDAARFCSSQGPCLEKVAADRAGYAALVERHAALIDRVEALSAYDHIAHPVGERVVDTILPPYQHGKLPATRHALLFLQGRRDEAFEGNCRAIATWRRLGSRSDLLISRLIGVAYGVDMHATLFAEMLAQVPQDAPLPAVCTEAFAPITDDELSLCRAMRGEFRFVQAALREAELGGLDGDEGPMMRLLQKLYFHRETTEADHAESLAWYCGEEALAQIRDDIPAQPPTVEQGGFRFQCIANAGGCVLSQIATPLYGPYAHRVQDANAKLRLIGLLLRLRADTADARPFAERLRAHAGDVGSSQRRVGVDEAGRRLRLRLFDTQKTEPWTIPLPAYFQPVANAAPTAP